MDKREKNNKGECFVSCILFLCYMWDGKILWKDSTIWGKLEERRLDEHYQYVIVVLHNSSIL